MTSKHTVATFFALVVLVTVLGSGLRESDPTLAQPAETSVSYRSALPLPFYSATPSLTPTATASPTSTPSLTPTITNTPSPTWTPTVTRTRGPTATGTPTPRVVRVPILMYHYVGDPPPDADKYRLDLTVTTEAFETQLDYLAINGYQPVRLGELVEYLKGGPALPEKPVVLTFDDGYTDNYTIAFPALRNHKFPATFFVITDFVNENRWGYMSWVQIADMVQQGMEVGSHSLNHPDLYRKTRAFQDKQVVESKNMIEAHIPITVQLFSYPSSRRDSNTIAALRAAGYLAAVTEDQGARQASNDLFSLDRIRIRGGYSVTEFARWIKYYAENGK